MVSQEYKDRLMQAVEHLPEDKLAEVLDFAEFLAGRMPRPKRGKPNLGFCRGQIKMDAFFDPLPDDILDAFEGKS